MSGRDVVDYAKPTDVVAEALMTEIFGLGSYVGYIAIRRGSDIVMRAATGMETDTSPESNFYEERLVNPTLLDLTRRRGELDCGGLRFVAVGYGGFLQFMAPIKGGHISIGLARTTPPDAFSKQVHALLRKHGLNA